MRIKELREARGITQRQLSVSMGVSQGAVSKWEQGLSLPGGERLPELADLLGCSIDALFGREFHLITAPAAEARPSI